MHRYHVEVWDEGHLDQAWKYLGPGFTSHATVTTMPPGPDFLAQLWSGFPDLRSHEEALLGDGVAPTGREIQVSGMDILRVADGKLVEHRGGVGGSREPAKRGGAFLAAALYIMRRRAAS